MWETEIGRTKHASMQDSISMEESTLVILAMVGSLRRLMEVQVSLDKKQEPTSKTKHEGWR
jgi:hypothetical protein